MGGRTLDNVDFFAVHPSSITEDELYNKLLTEFPQWVTQAKAK